MSPSAGQMTRRDFLALTAGSGLYVLIRCDPLFAQETSRLPTAAGYPSDFNAYLRIGEDGRTTCFVGKVELGQGSKTALAQLLAEELDVSFDSVDMVMGDTDSCPWDMGTFGSLSIRHFGPVLRAAGAEARAVLLKLAAERLAVPVDRLQVQAGIVTDRQDVGRSVSYSELVAGKRIERHLDDVPLKEVGAYTLVGTSAPRKDALEKVTGKARYAADVGPPDTLHARILRPPVHDARRQELDTRAAEQIEGVRIIRDDEMLAVLHERPDVADRALALVRARFDRSTSSLDETTIFEHVVAHAPTAEVVGTRGNLEEGERLAATQFERTYLNSSVAHAAMETHSAVARIDSGKATVWVSTQAPFVVRNQIAQALRVPLEDVRVVTPYVGGGFGGKTSAPQAVEAARLSKITGKPVQVVWNRAEEFSFDTFRPAAVVKIRSGLSSAGKICFWDFAVYAAGDREALPFYAIPHQRTLSAGGWQGRQPEGLHPFGVGPWRAPSANTNTFARESQIDVMAAQAGADPLDFRLLHLEDERMRRVVQAAAAAFGWKPRPAPSRRGVGLACATYLGTYVATCAAVTVDETTGHVQVERVVSAHDMGVVVNPEGARQQMEGGITMGLGYALSEEVRFRGGEVLDRNFDTYAIPRFSWLPKIETILIDNPQVPASGCGEPPVVCMGAVIANAIFDAVGVRLLQLPMTPARVKAALGR